MDSVTSPPGLVTAHALRIVPDGVEVVEQRYWQDPVVLTLLVPAVPLALGTTFDQAPIAAPDGLRLLRERAWSRD